MAIDEERLLNKEWRLSHLYKIVNKYKEQIVFKRNRAQEHFNKNKVLRNIILKSRQLGFTTDEGIDALDDTLFTKNFESLFIAHTQDAAVEIFEKKIDYAWKNIDPELSFLWKAESDTANKLRFNFGDDTFSAITVANSGRSGTYNRVHISEYAKLCVNFPKRAEEVITGTIPSVPLDGRIDIESTAEGMGGMFAEYFWEAWDRGDPQHPTQFKAHFYNWQWDDDEIEKVEAPLKIELMEESVKFGEYQKLHNLSDIEITYYYYKWLSLGKDWLKLRQEYPTTPQEAFVTSGSPYFDNEKILQYLQKAQEPHQIGRIELVKNIPHYEQDRLGDLKIYQFPSVTGSYVAGGDTAEGLEHGDYQVLDIMDNATLKTVAKLRNHEAPDEFAKQAYALGIWYNEAYMAIEANKDGLWVNTELFKMGYPNLYYREVIDDITNRVGRKLGFRTDERTRPYILSELRKILNNHSDIWTDKDFLQECLTFIRNAMGRPEAMSGKNDDCIMAKAIALEVRRNAPEAIDKEDQPEKTDKAAMIVSRLEQLYGKKNKVVSQSDYY